MLSFLKGVLHLPAELLCAIAGVDLHTREGRRAALEFAGTCKAIRRAVLATARSVVDTQSVTAARSVYCRLRRDPLLANHIRYLSLDVRRYHTFGEKPWDVMVCEHVNQYGSGCRELALAGNILRDYVEGSCCTIGQWRIWDSVQSFTVPMEDSYSHTNVRAHLLCCLCKKLPNLRILDLTGLSLCFRQPDDHLSFQNLHTVVFKFHYDEYEDLQWMLDAIRRCPIVNLESHTMKWGRPPGRADSHRLHDVLATMTLYVPHVRRLDVSPYSHEDDFFANQGVTVASYLELETLVVRRQVRSSWMMLLDAILDVCAPKLKTVHVHWLPEAITQDMVDLGMALVEKLGESERGWKWYSVRDTLDGREVLLPLQDEVEHLQVAVLLGSHWY